MISCSAVLVNQDLDELDDTIEISRLVKIINSDSSALVTLLIDVLSGHVSRLHPATHALDI